MRDLRKQDNATSVRPKPAAAPRCRLAMPVLAWNSRVWQRLAPAGPVLPDQPSSEPPSSSWQARSTAFCLNLYLTTRQETSRLTGHLRPVHFPPDSGPVAPPWQVSGEGAAA